MSTRVIRISSENNVKIFRGHHYQNNNHDGRTVSQLSDFVQSSSPCAMYV